MADELVKKRITEYGTEVTPDDLDNSDVIFVDSTQHGTRKLRLKGIRDIISGIQNEGIKSSGVSVTADNYATTITNINDQPVNTIYAYAAGLQSSIANLPSNAALNILHYTFKYSVSTNVGQVMIAIERSGENPAMYFRTTSGTPVSWGSWVKVANGSEISSIEVTIADLEKNLNDLREHTKNLFEPSNVINAYFTSAPIKKLDTTRLVFIPCDPNTTYTVSKTAGTRFMVGDTTDYPAVGVNTNGRLSNYTGTSVTYTTSQYANYLVAWVWNGATDIISSEEMLSSVQIELGDTATTYEKPYSAIDRILRQNLSPVSLPNGSDLNDYYGINKVYILGVSNTFLNTPNSTKGRRFLEIYSLSTSNYTIQRFTNITEQEEFVRIYASNTWGDWKSLSERDTFSIESICGQFDGLICTSHGGHYSNTAYENSPKAFIDARKAGILYQELDIVFTSDLEPVVAHSSFSDEAIRIADGDTSRIYFKDHTLSDLKTNYVFGDSDYTWTIQTLKEVYEFNRNLGCYICIDIGGGENNPNGSIENLVSYMINNGIKCTGLITSEIYTFDIIKNSSGANRYPLGIVVANTQTDSKAVAIEKINKIIAAKDDLNLDTAWCLIRRERIETGGDLLDEISSLTSAGVKIGSYSYNASTYSNDIPSFVDLVISANTNINYRRYLDAING